MNPQPPAAELIDIHEVAKRLHINVHTARRWSNQGRFPKIAINPRVNRYNWLAVVAALAAQTVAS